MKILIKSVVCKAPPNSSMTFTFSPTYNQSSLSSSSASVRVLFSSFSSFISAFNSLSLPWFGMYHIHTHNRKRSQGPDGQNMYNRVVLVCTVNVYIPSSLGRRPILRYQVLQVSTKLYSLHLQSED